MNDNEAVQLSIDLSGGRPRFARLMGVTEEAVRRWMLHGVPPGRVLQVCRVTYGAVTPHDLRPDLYPDPTWLPAIDDPPAPAGTPRAPLSDA